MIVHVYMFISQGRGTIKTSLPLPSSAAHSDGEFLPAEDICWSITSSILDQTVEWQLRLSLLSSKTNYYAVLYCSPIMLGSCTNYAQKVPHQNLSSCSSAASLSLIDCLIHSHSSFNMYMTRVTVLVHMQCQHAHS